MRTQISIRSTFVLGLLGTLAIAILIIVENSMSLQQQAHFEEKTEASKLMARCMTTLKAVYVGNEIAIDNINDPNETGIIGTQFSEITSGRGSLPIKLSTANPNFAALVVEQLHDAGLKKGDKVAMCFTGSFPALNIAVCAAVETMELDPVLITSVTSSSWGANSPDLTWLDMQRTLYESNLISFMPVASSIGGNEDLGRTLSKEGRALAVAAVERNQIQLINRESLQANIRARMEHFIESGKPIKAFVNVGGGIASLGSHSNRETLPSGLSKQLNFEDVPDPQGVVYHMVQEEVPVINMLNISNLMQKFDLPRDPVPLPEIGEGMLYEAPKYDLTVVGASAGVFLGLILVVMYYDKKQNKLGTQIIKENEQTS